MEKYAIIKIINGNFFLDSEWTDVKSAIVQWHAVCRPLWNAEDVQNAIVEIIDSKLAVVPGYIEYIDKSDN